MTFPTSLARRDAFDPRLATSAAQEPADRTQKEGGSRFASLMAVIAEAANAAPPTNAPVRHQDDASPATGDAQTIEAPIPNHTGSVLGLIARAAAHKPEGQAPSASATQAPAPDALLVGLILPTVPGAAPGVEPGNVHERPSSEKPASLALPGAIPPAAGAEAIAFASPLVAAADLSVLTLTVSGIETHLAPQQPLPTSISAKAEPRTDDAAPTEQASIEEPSATIAGALQRVAPASTAKTSQTEAAALQATDGVTAMASVAAAVAAANDVVVAAPPAVTHQVEGAIADLLAETAPRPRTPARTMVLQLSPDGLGAVSIRLHVSGRDLDVHLTATEPSTAGLLMRERNALADALAGRDYDLNTLVVVAADGDRQAGAGSGMAGTLHTDAPGGSALGASSDGDGAGRSGSGQGYAGQGGDDGARRGAIREARVRDPHGSGGGGTLYV